MLLTATPTQLGQEGHFARLRLLDPSRYDDFETFTGTQYHPCGLGTTVGHHSWFLYGLGFAPHRRGGHLSPVQRRRQQQWDRRSGKPAKEFTSPAFSASRAAFALLRSTLTPRLTVAMSGMTVVLPLPTTEMLCSGGWSLALPLGA